MNGLDTKYVSNALAPNYATQTLSTLKIKEVYTTTSVIHENIVINEHSVQSDKADISRNVNSLSILYNEYS
jgi:hypothetical protein